MVNALATMCGLVVPIALAHAGCILLLASGAEVQPPHERAATATTALATSQPTDLLLHQSTKITDRTGIAMARRRCHRQNRHRPGKDARGRYLFAADARGQLFATLEDDNEPW